MTTAIPTDVREQVAQYGTKGCYCVPLRPRSKTPARRDWTNLRLAPDVFPDNSNIGIILGEPSGWLVDVDLDCPEAIELADQYLPPTPAITGRPSSLKSHRWYIATGSTTQKHTDPNDGSMIVELRSTGAQTLIYRPNPFPFLHLWKRTLRCRSQCFSSANAGGRLIGSSLTKITRIHDDAVDAVIHSINTFGWRQPIVVDP